MNKFCSTCRHASESGCTLNPLLCLKDNAYLYWEQKELINPFDTQVGGNHYKKEGLMDVTEWCMKHDLDIGEFNVIKYTFRHPNKGGIEDLRKAKHYLEMIAYIKYGENL